MLKIVGICLTLALSTVLILAAKDETVDPSKPRTCYSCSGINCYRTSLVEANETCTDSLDICITVFQGFGVVAKGCFLDIPQEFRYKCEGESNKECHKCFGQLCNNVGREDFKCIECNSKNNDKCKTDTSGIKAVRCPIPTAPNSYCYVESKDDGSIERGCSTKVSHQRECFSGNGCALCLPSDGEACNSFNVNGAGSVVLGISAVVVAFVSYIGVMY